MCREDISQTNLIQLTQVPRASFQDPSLRLLHWVVDFLPDNMDVGIALSYVETGTELILQEQF